jgi:single stranded DNA-binding protein
MLNKVILQGRICQDLAITTYKNDSSKSYLTFLIAVDDRRKGKDVEPKTNFIRCVAFELTAFNIQKYFVKGDSILVEGCLSVKQNVDPKTGEKTNISTVVIIQSFYFSLKNKDRNQPLEKSPSDGYEARLPF